MESERVNVTVSRDTWRCLIKIKWMWRLKNLDDSVKWLILMNNAGCLDTRFEELAELYRKAMNDECG